MIFYVLQPVAERPEENKNETTNTAQPELAQLENDHRYLRDEILHFQNQFQLLTLKLETFEDISSENQNLKERITEQERNYIQENDDLKENVESLTRVNEATDVQLKEMSALVEENSQLKASLNQIVDANQLSRSNEEKIEQLMVENQQLQTRVDCLAATEKPSVSGNDALPDADEYVKEIAALNLKNESLNHQLDEFKEIIDRHVTENESKAIQNDELVSANLHLTEELKNSQACWEESRQQLQEKLAESSLYNQQLQQELDQHQIIMKELQASTQKATQELIAKNEELEQSESQTADLNSQCQQLQEKINSLETTLEELRARSQALEEQVESRTESRTLLADQITELEERCQSHEDGKKALAEQLEAARESLGRRDAELADVKTQLEAAKLAEVAQYERLSYSITELQQEKEQLNLTLQAFQQQREQLVQTVQQKHQEAVNYHAEAQRMAKICEDLQVWFMTYTLARLTVPSW